MTALLIGGDLCPMGRNEALFRESRAEAVFNDLLPEFQQADLAVVNLECPLIKHRSPIQKDGVALGASVECVQGIKAAGIGLVNLANNHILDHGEAGLRSTLAALDDAGIEYFGGGGNLEEAGRVAFHQVGQFRIGFLGVAEHEFTIAGRASCGANPLDVIECVRTLRRNRQECDFLIVLVHGGREHYRYPTPRLRQVCRFLVEEGASAVICQHSHCVGCYELHQKAPIVYGQGNLLFDASAAKPAAWREGLLVKLMLEETGTCRAEWIPFSQSLEAPGVRRMPPGEAEALLAGFEARSREIATEGFVERKWLEYCRKEKYLYASRIRGHNRLLRVLNRKLRFSDWLYSRTTKLILRNVVECETHREALETLWRDPETEF
ncbi:CapA family protein [Allochromatium vinosum]|uniref:CapA family protein n=1 Tax=Allochromatium vinosum TaxID=1049 RepID=UPI0019081F4A|nr:CapA family protein [Allochromatium vinosum]MBK1654993.1 hypothetical protein [Allochromatium vinosum]